MNLNAGDIFNRRYRILKAIGQGGFAKIWLADDLRTNLKVALKIYNGLDEDGVREFKNEFTIVFGMANPYLLRPVSFDIYQESIPYLVMPYCSQGSIYRHTGQMPEERLWKLLRDVSSGLAYLHGQAIPVVHQDIKPANILLSDTDDYVITDFGISMTIRNTLRRSAMAPVAGTLAYMAPERFSANPTPIIASDIWSLGATLFELMTGNAPFDNLGGSKQNAGASVPVITNQFSKELKSYVTACLQKEPWNRPTAATLADVAQRRLEGNRVRLSNTIKPVWWKRTYVWVSSAAAIAAIALVTGISYSGLRSGKKSPEVVIIANNQAEEAERNRIEEERARKEAEDSKRQEEERSKEAEAKRKQQEDEERIKQEATAWTAEYDRILNNAQSAYRKNNYESAKTEYNKALTLAKQNGDTQKTTFINGQIADCNRAIAAVASAEREARAQRERAAELAAEREGRAQRERAAELAAERESRAQRERTAEIAAERSRNDGAVNNEIQRLLSSYEKSGQKFGVYDVVQKKSTQTWGVIDAQGKEFIPCMFTDVTLDNLRDGYIGFRNGNSWDVYNSSGKCVERGITNLTKYQK